MKHDWEYKKLGDICDLLDAQRKPVSKAERKNGIYPYYGASGIQDYVDSYIFDGRYLLVGEDGAKWTANEKSAFIISGKCWVNNHAHILQMNDDVVDSFVEFYLCHQDLSSYITGAVVPKLTQQALKSISIPVPPLPTQQSIVSELDSLSKIIADCKETLKDYDALEQSIFYDMFGDPVKNEKGWDVKKLEDICSNIVDCPHSTPTKSDVPTIYPCIRTSELRNGEIYWDSMQYVEEEEYKNRIVRLQPQKDDIVFGREGSIGGAVILPDGYQFCLGQRTMLLRVDEYIIHSIFLHRVILSDWVKNQIMDKNVASTVAHVNVKDVKVFLIPVPPLPLQQQFASKIEAIEQMKSETKKALQEAETLFNARMDYWFN